MDAAGDDRRMCQICSEAPSKYVCPRCGVPYCSLACYKDERRHVKCSESFYKDCVMEGLKAQGARDPEGAKKMTQALQRFHQEYDEGQEDEEGDEEEILDSDDDEPLEKRLDGINLDNADEIWLQLTEEERAEFKRFAQDVDVQDIVPEWTPWWTIHPERKLVQEVQEATDREIEDKIHPEILQPIPTMSSLTKIKPNDHVKIGLTNVIAAYVWTSRLYNGEFVTYENPEEVAGAFVSLSSFLGKDLILTTFEHALADVSMNACRNPELFDGGPALQTSLNKDVLTILSGPRESNPQEQIRLRKSYILSALSECYKLLSKAVALQKSKSNQVKNNSSKISKQSKQANPRSRQPKKLIEEIVEGQAEATTLNDSEIPENVPERTDESESVPFEKVFANPRSFCIEPKVLTKAKRKLQYLLAFANEYDVL